MAAGGCKTGRRQLTLKAKFPLHLPVNCETPVTLSLRGGVGGGGDSALQIAVMFLRILLTLFKTLYISVHKIHEHRIHFCRVFEQLLTTVQTWISIIPDCQLTEVNFRLS